MARVVAVLGMMTGVVLLIASIISVLVTIETTLANPLAASFGGLFFLVSLTMGGIAWILIIVAYQHWYWVVPGTDGDDNGARFKSTTTTPDDYRPREVGKSPVERG